MADPTFEEIAAALYVGPPGAFVSSRKARSEETGDAQVAARILALRKPSIGAWVMNVFAQERSEQLAEALQLAQELREAQDDLDAPALAKLGRERRVLTRRLAQDAAALATARGERITSSTSEVVEQTISAAFFDPAAAAAVASGRLLRTLTPSSSADEIRDAVAGDVPELEPEPTRPPDELQARRVRREAERAVAKAEKQQAAAARELAKQDAAREALRTRAKEMSARVSELERQLTQARADASRVEREVPEMDRAREDAAQRADIAANAVEDARKALERATTDTR